MSTIILWPMNRGFWFNKEKKHLQKLLGKGNCCFKDYNKKVVPQDFFKGDCGKLILPKNRDSKKGKPNWEGPFQTIRVQRAYMLKDSVVWAAPRKFLRNITQGLTMILVLDT